MAITSSSKIKIQTVWAKCRYTVTILYTAYLLLVHLVYFDISSTNAVIYFGLHS